MKRLGTGEQVRAEMSQWGQSTDYCDRIMQIDFGTSLGIENGAGIVCFQK